MTPTTMRSITLLPLAGLLLAAAEPGRAADAAGDYPARPIRIVVPAATGGSTDPLARVIGLKLGEAWGRPVVIDNRPGAGTNVGTEIVAKSLPDGYTLLVTTSSVSINVSLYRKQGYHPLRDFAPVALLTDAPLVLVVHPSVPARNLADLIALARAKPGQLSYASSGAGSNNHLSIELMKTMTGIDIVHVPYKGGGPAVTDVLSGRIQLMASSAPTALPLVRAERLRAIAVSSSRRLASAPEIPPMSDTVPGLDVSVWYGMLAPAGTPQPVVRKLNAEVMRILAMPDVKERLAAVGVETTGSTPEAFAKYLRSEVERWAKVIKAAGAVAD